MKNLIKILTTFTLLLSTVNCAREDIPTSKGFEEEEPDTITFTNAEFVYNGDDIGDAFSDGWLIKFHTDMEIDESGAPIGPGCVMQILTNARYSEEQKASPEILAGTYGEMMNSMNFSPYTFVPGYMSVIYIPGGDRLEFADASFYADIKEGTTEMDYDLLDEGSFSIRQNDDGTFTIEGVLVGHKYTKRYFTWTGEIVPVDNVPEETPNSTLKHDMTGLVFSKGLLQDKGDYFYLGDESCRCLLLYLVEDNTEFSFGRPTGNGAVLRLEMLVPWETDFKNGIPEGTYEMIPRNEDTSMDRDKIVPGGAIEGLPDVFEAWKMSGCWYYELNDGLWTDTYARISGGAIKIDRGEDGSHTISYDLTDCQKSPKKLTGSTFLQTLKTY